jgi:hypothetical protein
MIPSPIDLGQSFRLRFWRESRRGAPDDWRGNIWHEQLGPGHEIAVASPEQAFELIRRSLQSAPREIDSELDKYSSASGENLEQGNARVIQPTRSRHSNPVLFLWRKLKGKWL